MSDFISVIMPVYNGAAFIGAALESIAQQSQRPDEIIVVDDGSTDDTAAIVQNYDALPIRYIYQENAGANHARNRGLMAARGNMIAFLDADDTWTAEKTIMQRRLLGEADVVIGHTRILGQSDSLPFILPSLCCALMRRSAFEQVGIFDPDLQYSDDMDWYMRVREAGLRIILHHEVVLLHRRHEHNLTKNLQLRNSFQLKMLHKSLQRRRENGQQEANLAPFSEFIQDDRPSS